MLTVLLGVLVSSVAGAALEPPPIVTGKDAGGVPFTVQTYDVPPIRLDLDVLSIAERYREAAKWGGSIPALDTSVVCEIADDGTVERNTCEADSWSNREQGLAMRLARSAPQSALPRFPAIDRVALGVPPRGTGSRWSKLVRYNAPRGDARPFYRLARLSVQIDKAPFAVDLTTGPLTDSAQIVIEAGRSARGISYPSQAMREEKQGTQTVECQVQVDRSVICHSESFDPSENAPYFVGAAEDLFRNIIVKDRLKDGGNSIGVRFRTKLRWILPT